MRARRARWARPTRCSPSTRQATKRPSSSLSQQRAHRVADSAWIEADLAPYVMHGAVPNAELVRDAVIEGDEPRHFVHRLSQAEAVMDDEQPRAAKTMDELRVHRLDGREVQQVHRQVFATLDDIGEQWARGDYRQVARTLLQDHALAELDLKVDAVRV